MPDSCGRDDDCPLPYVCMNFECDVPDSGFLCDPQRPQDANCGDYRSCRQIQGGLPLCVTELTCAPEEGCPEPFVCSLDNRCVARDPLCAEQQSLDGFEISEDVGVCDLPLRPRGRRCSPGLSPSGCPQNQVCQEIHHVAEVAELDEEGVCTESFCREGRDCPMGQYCEKGSNTCKMATLCGGDLDTFRRAPHEASATARCPDGQVCVAMEQVFGENSRICLSNDMSCEEHADCQDRHFSGVCFNGQCAYQAEHHCDPEMMGENGIFGQAVCVESQDFGVGDLSGEWNDLDENQDDIPDGFGLLNLDAPVYTSIDGPRDVDLFQFDAPSNGRYRFGTRYAQTGLNGALWNNTGDFDTSCWLHHANQEQLIGYNEYPEEPANEDQGSHCQVELTLAQDTRVYFSIHASDFWGDWRDPRPHVQAYVECLLGDCAEEDAEDDHGDLNQATNLEVLVEEEGLSARGEIGPSGDVDAFNFFPSEAGTITASLFNAPAGMTMQAHFGGGTLNSCETGNGGLPNRCGFTFNGVAGNSYILSVRGSGDVVGSYELSIQLETN